MEHKRGWTSIPPGDRCPSAVAGCSRHWCADGDPRRARDSCAGPAFTGRPERLVVLRCFSGTSARPTVAAVRQRPERSIAPSRGHTAAVGEPIFAGAQSAGSCSAWRTGVNPMHQSLKKIAAGGCMSTTGTASGDVACRARPLTWIATESTPHRDATASREEPGSSITVVGVHGMEGNRIGMLAEPRHYPGDAGAHRYLRPAAQASSSHAPESGRGRRLKAPPPHTSCVRNRYQR